MNHPEEELSTTPSAPAAASESRIDSDSIRVGEMLGRGAFCRVYEVHLGLLDRSQRSGFFAKETDVKEHRRSLTPFAMKRIRSSILRTKRPSFVRGVRTDLKTEANILSRIMHPHIVRLHYVTPDEESSDPDGQVLYMERLYGTVAEQLRKTSIHHSILPVLSLVSIKRRRLQREKHQCSIALPVARALEYLHSRRIIYRDLKPANVGYDAEGRVKLFDFGLARDLRDMDDNRRLTGSTGSMRYMAPEVYKGEDYGLPADVYSFGLFLWEVSTLKKPYARMTGDELVESVFNGTLRPKVNWQCGSLRIQKLLRRCWDVAPSVRPSFSEINEILSEELSCHEEN